MAKHLYLPKIQTNANIDKPTVDALWEDKQRKIILAISDGIEIDERAQTKGVSSIPDIYARPLTFLNAFRSEKHPIRKRIIQEWRGLISLLALHKVKPDLSNLTVTPVALGTDRFSVALKNLAPKSIQLQKNGTEYLWTDILLIKFNDIPVGSFSPATLVYTSSDYSKKLNAKSFSLKDELGYLRPPTKLEDLEFVGEWLEWFIRAFNEKALTDSNASPDYKYAGDINKQLQTWLDEIKSKLGREEIIDAAKVKIDSEPIQLTNSSTFLSNYHIYQLLLTPLAKDPNSDEYSKSDYSLKTSRNVSGYKEIVLINSMLLEKDQQLWDGTTPSDLGDKTTLIEKAFKTAHGTKITTIDLKDHNSVWVRPELFFVNDTLVRNKTTNILNNKESHFNANSEKYILPFSQEILKYFSPENIQDILEPRFEEKEGSVTFIFSLPLKNNNSVEIKKIFRTKSVDKTALEGQIIDIEVPVLEIFPNYIGDFWCQYFMLYSDSEKYLMEPLHFDNKISTDRREQKFETNNLRSKAEIVKISGYNSFPEAIEFIPKENSGISYGIILLKKDPDLAGKPFSGSCVVGIDFGTSNTNIYKYSGGTAKKWKFSFSKYLRSVTNSPENKRNEITRLFFIPTVDCELPIPTALRIFKAGIVNNMLLDHFIYFPHEARYPHNVYTGIKWDDDNTNLNLFIKSLIFLLLVDLMQERVGNIEFRCSYPKSFSDKRRQGYIDIWAVTLEGLFHAEDNLNNSIGDRFIYVHERRKEQDFYIIDTNENGRIRITVKPKFATEGISAGEYFSNESTVEKLVNRADKLNGSICIDVGGGTSDFSIWYDNEIRFDASVLLAGNQIAKLIKNNSRVRDLLLTEDSAEALNEVRENEKLFSSRLNFVLRKEEKDISTKLTHNSNNRDIDWLKRILAIEFGALSFYAAHLCLALDQMLLSELSNRIKENGIKLHWGGNAAKFINWIDNGKYNNEGIAAMFLNGMFVNTIMDKAIGEKGFRPAILGQVQSPGHKDEASGGIVVMKFPEYGVKASSTNVGFIIVDEEEQDDKDTIIVGEEVVANGKVYSHYSIIQKNEFFKENTSLFTETKLTQLERFIFLINQVGKKIGLFPEGSQISLSLDEKLAIKQRIKNDMAALAMLRPEERNLEPVFIMEVKYLLDILSERMR